jgi:hypothetical protein
MDLPRDLSPFPLSPRFPVRPRRQFSNSVDDNGPVPRIFGVRTNGDRSDIGRLGTEAGFGLPMDLSPFPRESPSIIEDEERPRRRGRLLAEGGSGDAAAGLGEGVEGYGEDDDDSDNDLLDVGGDVHEHEAVEENADEDGADDSSEDGADAAK